MGGSGGGGQQVRRDIAGSNRNTEWLDLLCAQQIQIQLGIHLRMPKCLHVAFELKCDLRRNFKNLVFCTDCRFAEHENIQALNVGLKVTIFMNMNKSEIVKH